MDASLVLGASVLLQLSAAVLALWLIRVTGHRLAWVLIATAVALMAVRRAIALSRLLVTDRAIPPDMSAEVVALVISILMVAGIALIVPVFRAITRSEEALRESSERLSTIVNSEPGCIELLELDGIVRDINPAGLNMLQLRLPSELVGSRMAEWIHSDDRAAFEEFCKRIAIGASEALECRLVGKKNAVVWIAMHAAPLRDSAGRVSSILMIGRDMTQRKEAEVLLQEAHEDLERRVIARTTDLVAANDGLRREIAERQRVEEALGESEKRIQDILDNAGVVIYVKDLAGVYLLANNRYAEVFHLTVDDIVGKTDLEIHPKETADAFRANDEQALHADGLLEFEETAAGDDGPHTYISQKFRLHDSAGEPYAICGISTDITDRKRAEEKLAIALEAAEAASRAKTAFLANISHEIRTPITAVLGAAELLDPTDSTVELRREQIDMILRNGQHLLLLINDLLDLSRAEFGRMEVRLVSCSLAEIIAGIQAVAEPLHRRSEVELRIVFETPIPTTIRTDPTRLKQAVINMVTNALKFTQAGYVHLRVSVAQNSPDPRLVFVVEDSGPGILAADLENVFSTFTNVRSTSSEVLQGAGLGLPMVKWIAEQLGGSVTVQSDAGQGTTFTLRVATGSLEDAEWLMVGDTLIAPNRPYSASSATKPKYCGKILLAEDFEDTRRIIEQTLADHGVDVTSVTNGEEAVEAALRESFDLILMDIRMPRLDGISATLQLRRQGCLAPIIALTASTTVRDEEHLAKAGFDEQWSKPIKLDALIKAIAPYLVLDQTSQDSDDPHDLERSVIEAGQGGTSRLAVAIRGFALSLGDRFEHIEAAVVDGDAVSARESLHQLAGAGGIHGFDAISDEARRLLAMAKTGSLCGNPDELTTLKTLMRQASNAVV